MSDSAILASKRTAAPTHQEGPHHTAHMAPTLSPTDPFIPPPMTDSARIAAALPDLPGYEILSELGRGGMGIVYRARQKSLNRIVALKMILAGPQAGPEELSRFRAEAEAVARLDHPNIVHIYEVGEQNGLAYFSLEYVDGTSLAHKLNGQPQGFRFAAELTETLARAIHAAHSRHIIHRDLKPANVLLTSDGTPKITDFGLAKHLDASTGNTQSGSIVGTPSYMAPEQAAGRTRDVSPATDVYALGAILYEMLTGRPPFRAETPLDTILQVISGDPVPPRQLQPKVPRDLETICLKSLEKDPHRRYASAEALAEDCAAFLRGDPITARPIRQWKRALKWCRKHRALTALYVGGVLATLVLIIGALWSNAALRAAAHREEEHASQAEQAHARAQTLLADSRRQLVRLNVANGARLLDNGDLLGALLWFAESLRLKESMRDPTREEVHRVRLAAVLRGCPRLAQLWLHEARVNHAAFSADGRWVVTISEDHTARVWDVSGAAASWPLEHDRPVRLGVLTADGRRLITVCDDGKARLWDVRKGELLALLGHGAPVLAAAFSNNGQLCTVDAEGILLSSDERGQRIGELPARAGVPRLRLAHFSPDARRLVTIGVDGVARLWDCDTARPLPAPLAHAGAVNEAAFSGDGRLIVTVSQDHTARVWHSIDGKPASPPLKQAHALILAAFNPDGKRVVTVGTDNVTQVWDVLEGQPVGSPIRQDNRVSAIAFSPEGRRLLTVSMDNTVRLWDATTGEPLLTPLRHNGTVYQATFAPDGRHVLTASQDHLARLWDVTVLPPRLPAVEAAGERHLTLSPDGKKVVTFSGDHTARIRQAVNRDPIGETLKHRGPILHAAFNPDSSRVVTASEDNTAIVWDAASGRAITPPLKHGHVVVFAAFSADGRRLVTASKDNTARVWDAASGKALTPPLEHNDDVKYAGFCARDRCVVTLTINGTLRVWDAVMGEPLTPSLRRSEDQTEERLSEWELPPDRRPVQDLLLLAQVLSGHRIDASEGLLPLAPDTLYRDWNQLRQRYPGEFASSAEQVKTWRRREADACIRSGQWHAAVWHLNRLVAEDPTDASLQQQRARAHAALGDWARTVADCDRAIALQPLVWQNWSQRGAAQARLGRWDRAAADLAQAVALANDPAAGLTLPAEVKLESGDLAGFRAACASLLAGMGSEDVERLCRLARLRALVPGAAADFEHLATRLEKAAGMHPRKADARLALGAVLLRAGRSEQALLPLSEAAEGESPAAWLFLALAYHGQGKKDQARRWLDRARQWIEKTTPRGPTSDFLPLTWSRRLELTLLCREAESLILSGKSEMP